MKIIIAIDSFKGCLTSAQAGEAALQGVKAAAPHARVMVVPVSDGGEGMMHTFTAALGGHKVRVRVHDPLMRPITAHYGISEDGHTAIIEMAQACGLTMLAPSERNPLRATSFGLGELMAHAIKQGCRRLIVGLGGTATSDCGTGMLQALGMKMEDDGIDTSQFLPVHEHIEVIAACDVRNPLYGPEGAAQVFAPQKGATPAMVELLDAQARHFATLTAHHINRDVAHVAGAGAAGGTGFALMAFMGAKLQSGIDLLLDLVDFGAMLDGAHLVITGEGRADRQTLMGKVPHGILRRAQQHHVPTALLAGMVEDRDALLNAGFSHVECINPDGQPLTISMQPQVAAHNIIATTRKIINT